MTPKPLPPKPQHWTYEMRVELAERFSIMDDAGVPDAARKAEAIIRSLVVRGQIVPGAGR